jgi:hypothetical protein
MSLLPSGLTAQQVIDGIGELLELGLDQLGQEELAALVPAATKLADAIANLAQAPSPATVLQGELAAADAGNDAAEAAKFPKG